MILIRLIQEMPVNVLRMAVFRSLIAQLFSFRAAELASVFGRLVCLVLTLLLLSKRAQIDDITCHDDMPDK